jgi:small-conductance mechanosensitive channel
MQDFWKYLSEDRWAQVAAASVGLVLTLLLVRLVATRLKRYIESLEGDKIKEVGLQGVSLISATTTARCLKIIVRLGAWTAGLFISYVYFAFLLLLFPQTRFIADKLQSGLKNGLSHLGLAIWGYLPNLFTIIFVIVICRYIMMTIGVVMTAIGKEKITLPGFDPDWADATDKLLRFLAAALTLVVVAPLLPGAASPAFRGISVFAGILLSLGSGGAISHVVSGVFLTYTNSFKEGDVVRIGEVQGTLIKKGLLVTQIRTPKNEEITIPNGKILDANVVNFSKAALRKDLVIHSTITLGYDAPWVEVHELLKKCAEKTEGLLKDPKPWVLQTALDGAWVAYEINAYTDQAGQMPRIHSDLRANIQDVFNEAGIELMTTSFHSVRDGNLSTIPDGYDIGDQSKRGFRLLDLWKK